MAAPLTYQAALFDALASGATMGLIGLLGATVSEPWAVPQPRPDHLHADGDAGG
jgi:hypothetical protein